MNRHPLTMLQDQGRRPMSNYGCISVLVLGVSCSGSDPLSVAQVDGHLRRTPIKLSLGHQHSCIRDLEGVKCWGFNAYGQTDVPLLRNPSTVGVGLNYTCAI